jgi:single-strand DNA-binding protein
MNSLNSILLEGNVTRDAELKTTPAGSAVCTFSIASNRSWKKGEEWEQEVSFFDIETWGKLAEYCGAKCLKGTGVRVVGRLKQDRWTDADGKARSKSKIVAEHIEFKPNFKNRDDAQTQQPPADIGPPPDGIPF